MSVDEDGFIKSTDYTAGNVHDSNCFTDLLNGNETPSMRIAQAHGTCLSSLKFYIHTPYEFPPALALAKKCFTS